MRCLILMVIVTLMNCTDNKGSEKILKSQGYTYIEMTGYKFLACGNDDFYHTGFYAKTYSGMRVSGVVCSGLFFKGSTIRITD